MPFQGDDRIGFGFPRALPWAELFRPRWGKIGFSKPGRVLTQRVLWSNTSLNGENVVCAPGGRIALPARITPGKQCGVL